MVTAWTPTPTTPPAKSAAPPATSTAGSVGAGIALALVALIAGCTSTAPRTSSSAMPPMPPAPALRAEGVSLAAVASTYGLIFGWDASPTPGVTGYRLWRGINGAGYAVAASTPALTATVTGLLESTPYTFYCTAIVGGIDGPPSNVVTYNLLPTNQPPVTNIVASFTNATPIAIPDFGKATPYPSKITVAGVQGVVSNVTVTLRGFTQSYPGDVDVLLVSPAGAKAMILSDVGGTFDLAGTGITLTLSDAATASLPTATTLTAGTFKPTDASPGEARDVFPAPAPVKPYATTLSAFNRQAPNGDWLLYVQDDGAGDRGSFSGGWSLSFAAGSVTNPPVNTPPTISNIPSRTNAYVFTSTTVAIPLTIGDVQTSAANLTLTATSSNPALVPVGNIVFGGSGTAHTVTATPVANRTGKATITVTVSDGTLSASDSWDLVVAGPVAIP